jgi:hypothetical protein
MSNLSILSQKINKLAAQFDDILAPHENICSQNTKTGASINFPVGCLKPIGTCWPSSVCKTVCYGAMAGKPITWEASLKKYIRVYRYFLITPAKEIADRIHTEYVRRKMTFLRWNGVGDLFPESAAVILQMTKRHPEDILLVVTRKPEMVSLIPRTAENLYLMFSLDGSDESKKRKINVLNRRHPRLYFSFLRLDPDENTMGARIVFNVQQAKKIMPYDDPVTVCPVDADKIPVKGACVKCRKCFNPTVLDGRIHPNGE